MKTLKGLLLITISVASLWFKIAYLPDFNITTMLLSMVAGVVAAIGINYILEDVTYVINCLTKG